MWAMARAGVERRRRPALWPAAGDRDEARRGALTHLVAIWRAKPEAAEACAALSAKRFSWIIRAGWQRGRITPV